ncbi:MAG TPA: type IX secretion system membrane protein PorP/SprF, partial [Phaeodactylibacter sp.]|nr:type IX secretion system membrane protein PorP/SprF [Phaeodactylibacter sp.]
SLTALYRRQWIGFKNAPESKLLSFDAPIFGDKVGFGLTISQQTMGIQNNWYANMAYSYHIKISKASSFRIGLQASMKSQGLDFADPGVYIRETGDQSILENETVKDVFANFGAGLYYTFGHTYVGVSVPYFYPAEIGLNKSPNLVRIAETAQHYYLMLGTMLKVSEKMDIKPALLVKYVKNAPFDMDVNVMLVFDKKFNLGLSYRMGGTGIGESVDLMAMYQYNQIAFGLAYDMGLSALKAHQSGSVEALIRYDFVKEKGDMANPRFFF